ncbi:WD repeat-containing protein 18-like [Teleopsis dalmanni]|uniref:WD repeat-containing protein 18-like n=1 Tax=Teleopsis dalmanni TaxID=139649 RepID=UPI0018CF073F|nr:WD repeat-containing protein 18-like [Teleopsis dalmanni]XP_037938651.1 WD repeat-containing protein 18-like [Teleopsis dalmanni]XP_037939667.1 WD repeat-containing protein 18-like [Teleopsis dalmanni]XP_037939668.1 WD repeat-containing protein 18-like [Teleopsis dalmanni]
MNELAEVIFSSCADGDQVSCNVWDFRNATNLMTYKGGGTLQKRSLCVLRSEYVLAANSSKPLLHIWPINSQEQTTQVRFVTPGIVNALAISLDGLYLIAAVQETIYIWNLTSGRMLNMISKHYQPIKSLCFTSDGSHFISAGQDGAILVWNLTQIVSKLDDNQTPLYTFTDHGLGITDIFIGIGGIRSFMYSVSLDRTCKIYDLCIGNLLLNVVFAEALYSVVANSLETRVYVGTGEGNIYEINIGSVPRTKEYHMEVEKNANFSGHTPNTSVDCLVLSIDGQTLLSGGQDKLVYIWHISSKQLIRTIQNKGSIMNIKIQLTNVNTFQSENKQRNLFNGNLQRIMESTEVDEHESVEVLVTQPNIEDTYEKEQSVDADLSCLHFNVKDDSAQNITELRAEIQRLKKINKSLFLESALHILNVKK